MHKDGAKAVEDAKYIKSGLENGGRINIDTVVFTKIDDSFPNDFALFDEEGMYYTKPAMMNFIGSYGWELHSMLGKNLVFKRSR